MGILIENVSEIAKGLQKPSDHVLGGIVYPFEQLPMGIHYIA
jgi:hypothetical protein